MRNPQGLARARSCSATARARRTSHIVGRWKQTFVYLTNTTCSLFQKEPKTQSRICPVYVAEEKHSVGPTGLLSGGPAAGPPLFCKVGGAGRDGGFGPGHVTTLLLPEDAETEAMPVVSMIVLSPRCLLYTLAQLEGALGPA